AMRDFNGDGLLDLGVTSCYYGLVQFQCADVLLGNGDGGFLLSYSTSFEGGVYGDYATVVADLNGDGFDDFVTSTEGPGVTYAHVLLSNHRDGLQVDSSYFIGEHYTSFADPVPVAAADLDADGDTDLVVMNRVLLGDGAGGFRVGNYGASGSGAVVLGDF